MTPRPPVPCMKAPDAWFAERTEAAARQGCAGCYFRPDCLTQAMAWESGTPGRFRHGVWGGLNGAERFALEERERAAA